MARNPDIVIRLVITNPRALRALAAVEEYLTEEADGREWDEGLARALRAAKFARKHLTAEGDGE